MSVIGEFWKTYTRRHGMFAKLKHAMVEPYFELKMKAVLWNS